MGKDTLIQLQSALAQDLRTVSSEKKQIVLLFFMRPSTKDLIRSWGSFLSNNTHIAHQTSSSYCYICYCSGIVCVYGSDWEYPIDLFLPVYIQSEMIFHSFMHIIVI